MYVPLCGPWQWLNKMTLIKKIILLVNYLRPQDPEIYHNHEGTEDKMQLQTSQPIYFSFVRP